MSTRPILKILTFISASAIVGLAAAFIAVVVRPELIARRAPGAGRARAGPGQARQDLGHRLRPLRSSRWSRPPRRAR